MRAIRIAVMVASVASSIWAIKALPDWMSVACAIAIFGVFGISALIAEIQEQGRG